MFYRVMQKELEEAAKKFLTGSHQVELNKAISQSLAGRLFILHLLPLSLKELEMAGINKSVDAMLYEGCYPRIHADHLNPTKTYVSYV